ncbi:hypothetical protein ACC780_38005, partial [Rhizobium ruizarguesonis]
VADQIGMTAANFAGSAARVAVAAPFAVISPEAREILKREPVQPARCRAGFDDRGKIASLRLVF